jgi:hypothetical protein
MRKEVPSALEAGRVTSGPWATTPEFGLTGVFRMQAPSGAELAIGGHTGEGPMVAVGLADGERTVIDAKTGWEHVTVHVDGDRTPTWEEMCFAKDLFWKPEEACVQYHPPASEYVNARECLHLWRPIHATIPAPSVALAKFGFE